MTNEPTKSPCNEPGQWDTSDPERAEGPMRAKMERLSRVIDRLTDDELLTCLHGACELANNAKRMVGPDGQGTTLSFLLDCGVSVLLAEWMKRGHSING